jgi:osmotically inducible lipoprotein OsmB
MLEAVAGWPARDVWGQATANGKGCMNKTAGFGKLALQCNMKSRDFAAGQAKCSLMIRPDPGPAIHGPLTTLPGTASAAVSFVGPSFLGGDGTMRKTISLLAVTGALMALAACNTTTEQKAAAGAIGGAVVAGPVGAAVGGAAGAVAGHVQDDAAKH